MGSITEIIDYINRDKDEQNRYSLIDISNPKLRELKREHRSKLRDTQVSQMSFEELENIDMGEQ